MAESDSADSTATVTPWEAVQADLERCAATLAAAAEQLAAGRKQVPRQKTVRSVYFLKSRF